MDKHVFKYFKLLPETEKNSNHDNIIIMDDCTQSDHGGVLHIFQYLYKCIIYMYMPLLAERKLLSVSVFD